MEMNTMKFDVKFKLVQPHYHQTGITKYVLLS